MPLFRRRRAWAPPDPICTLLVHCARPLPALGQIAHRDGAEGAVRGLPDPSGLDEPDRPLRYGDVVRIVTPAGGLWSVEVGIPDRARMPDPEIWTTLGIGDELGDRLARATTQLVVERLATEAPAGPDVLFGTRYADRIAALSGGVVSDVHALRVFGPGGWRNPAPSGELDARDHIVIHAVPDDEAPGTWVHTHGLVKFGRPELEAFGVPDALVEATAAYLNGLAQYVLEGALIEPGDTIGDPDEPLVTREGGRDRWHWAGTPVLELVDRDGRTPAHLIPAS